MVVETRIEAVVGMEVHAELLTESKMLATVEQYGAQMAVFGTNFGLREVAGEQFCGWVQTPVSLVTAAELQAGASPASVEPRPDPPNRKIGKASPARGFPTFREFAVALNHATNDSNVNAVVVYHDAVTNADLDQLRQIGIQGGTRFRALPMVYVTGTKSQIVAVSHLTTVRSIYGNRTLTFNSDPYFNKTGVQRVAPDTELQGHNNGLSATLENENVS